MEDWDFWLTMMENGSWGYTLPEFLFWYRTNPKSFRRKRWPNLFESYPAEAAKIQEKHSALRSGLPIKLPKKYSQCNDFPPHAIVQIRAQHICHK